MRRQTLLARKIQGKKTVSQPSYIPVNNLWRRGRKMYRRMERRSAVEVMKTDRIHQNLKQGRSKIVRGRRSLIPT